MRPYLPVISALLCAGACAVQPPAAAPRPAASAGLRVATWNVHDLFDAEDRLYVAASMGGRRGLVHAHGDATGRAIARFAACAWCPCIPAEEQAQSRIQEYSIHGAPDTRVESLSGGNQQRALLALLHPDLNLLLLEHPTRGLDIESTMWVWNQLLERRRRGSAIIFASADLDEIYEYSDRILVFSGGELVFYRSKELPEGSRDTPRFFREINSSFLVFQEKHTGQVIDEVYCVCGPNKATELAAVVGEATGRDPLILDAGRFITLRSGLVGDQAITHLLNAAIGAATRNL